MRLNGKIVAQYNNRAAVYPRFFLAVRLRAFVRADCSRAGPASAKGSSVADDMLKSFLEPVKTDKDESGVYEYWSREHGNEVEDDLLVRVKQVEVHRIQATLGSRTGREEERINVLQVIAGVDDNGGYQSHRDNVDVMDTDEVQMQILYEWYSGLVARQLAKDGGKHPGRATAEPPWYRGSQVHNSLPRAGAGAAVDICMFSRRIPREGK